MLLTVADPAGGAGGDHGQDAPLLHARQKLRALLHNGEVGGVVHVKDLVEAQAAQGGHHFALHVGADGHTEAFAQGGADGGGGADNHMLALVGQRLPDLVGIVLFGQRAGGADHDALAAGHAGNVVEGLLKRAGDVGVHTPVVGADHRHILLTASGHAATAENAFVVVPHQMGGGAIRLIMRPEAVVASGILHPVIPAKLLQLAIAGTHAGEALLFMGGEQQLQGGAAGLLHLGGVGLNFHSLRHGINAGGHQAAGAGSLHHADAAGADFIDILQKAEGGDFHAGIPGGFRQGTFYRSKGRI